MNIVHIIDRYTKVNYGIWHAVTNTAPVLNTQFGYITYLVYPEQNELGQIEGVTSIPLQSVERQSIEKMLSDYSFSPSTTIIVTHGCWQYPTKWGAELKRNGYSWVYVPHGMLEPNSMGQKYWKKLLYFYLIERRLARRASVIRAVSKPEMYRLALHFIPVLHIPNAVPLVTLTRNGLKASTERTFLYMARIHVQKGILELVKAWKHSTLSTSSQAKLVIAGPDDGALDALKREMEGINNIEYCGAVYGADKDQLLRDSDFFVLPSRAEGFPGSVIEAMSYGLVPIMTTECNFPEAVEAGCAFLIERNERSIATTIEHCVALDEQNVMQLKTACMDLIANHYSMKIVANQFHRLYSTMIHGK